MSDQKRFYLQRDIDESSLSGTGRVANGVVWPDGSADVRWCGEHGSTAHWDRFESVPAIHGHEGRTRLVWLDTPDPTSDFWWDE